MAEKSSITAKAVNSLRFSHGGLATNSSEHSSDSSDSMSLKERYLQEVENYTNINRKTARNYFEAAVDPASTTEGFDREVDYQLKEVLRRAQKNQALRLAKKRKGTGIMSGRQTAREGKGKITVGIPDNPTTTMLRHIRDMFNRMDKEQSPATIEKIDIA